MKSLWSILTFSNTFVVDSLVEHRLFGYSVEESAVQSEMQPTSKCQIKNVLTKNINIKQLCHVITTL